MIFALTKYEYGFHPLKISVIRESFVPDDFLSSCVDEMLHAYSHAMEAVMLGFSEKMVVRTLDYDLGNIGPMVLECQGRDAHIYYDLPSEKDRAEATRKGKRLFDVTLPIKDLYSEMHNTTRILRLIRRAYEIDKAKVFGMDLSQNFDSLENSRYFNTENGESGIVTDMPEGREWLKEKLRERDEREARLARERGAH